MLFSSRSDHSHRSTGVACSPSPLGDLLQPRHRPPFPGGKPYLYSLRRGFPYTKIQSVLLWGFTYPKLSRIRADSFLPEFLEDVPRGIASCVFLVRGKERTDHADGPKRRDPFAFDGRYPRSPLR